MDTGRFGEAVVGAAGSVAGAVTDPRQGLARLRSALPARTLVTVAAGLVVGILLARSRLRS